MSFSYIDEIFAFAIEKEEEAVAFYMDLSKKEKFASLKETFKIGRASLGKECRSRWSPYH